MAYDVILSGKITGDDEYRQKFAKAYAGVRARRPGVRVWNPATLPDDREYRWYVRTCLDVIMNEAAPGCVLRLLPGWNRSLGAVAEWAVARCLGIKIEFGE
jgi:hypothetical protein